MNMVELFIGPRWFLGIDTLFELISIIVSFLISLFAYKIYKLASQKKYLNFSLAFFLIAIGLFFKIISNFVVFYKTVEKTFYGLFTVTYTYSFNSINLISLFLFRFLTLTAFLMILANILKIKDKRIITLMLFFTVIATIFSNYAYFVFHLTLALILGFISFYYFKNTKIKRSRSAFMVMFSFLALFLSQILFVFFALDHGFYAFGEILQLVGFLFLLFAYISVFKK